MRAMVLDISKSLTLMLSQHLQKLGVKTLVESRSDRALAMLQQVSCDLICVAMHLEDEAGTTFVEQLRKLKQHQHTHVIMLAPDADRELLAKALRVGVNDVLGKEKLNQVLEYLSDYAQKFRLDSSEGRVLYVEDDRTTAILLLEQLKHLGLQADHVTTADDALALFKSNAYDLILIDHVLSKGMSGLELVKVIRKIRSHPFEAPIMVLSAQSDEVKKVEILRSGANDYLDKNASREEISVRLTHLVKSKRLFDQVKYQQEKLQHLAMTDQLTGLYNRHYLFEAAPQKISEAQRHHFPVALIIVDLDKFKLINDTHGHAAGDSVLKATALLLKQSCRREDIVARFGGEEFVILLDHCPAQQALQKAEQMRAALEILQPDGLPITASFGVRILAEQDKSSFSEMFGQADEAVYAAKHNGRNQVTCYGSPPG